MTSPLPTLAGPVLRLLRQQHITWAFVGHSAPTAEEGARAVERVLPWRRSITRFPYLLLRTRMQTNEPTSRSDFKVLDRRCP
jgi:hypothetical protein